MDIMWSIVGWIGVILIWTSIILCGSIAVYAVYDIWISNYIAYRKARKQIIPWVEGYRSRCTGNNRFIVTPEELQDAFREYDYTTICKVWNELVDKRIIQQDPMDQAWCIR